MTRRFGREVLDYLAEPFLGGVHASNPKSMSLAATFPMYLDMEQRSGSVIRASALGVAARERAAAGKPKDPNSTVFATFRLGMHQLADAMAAEIGTDNVRTSCGVASVEAVGHKPSIVKSGHHDPDFYRALWDRLRQGIEFRFNLLISIGILLIFNLVFLLFSIL